MVYVDTFWSREEGSVVKEKNKKRKRFNRSSKFESIWAWISDQIVYICRQFRRNCIHLPKTFLNAEKLAEVRIYLISRSNDHIIWWLKKSSSPLAWLFFILMGEVHLPKRLKGWMGLKKKKKRDDLQSAMQTPWQKTSQNAVMPPVSKFNDEIVCQCPPRMAQITILIAWTPADKNKASWMVWWLQRWCGFGWDQMQHYRQRRLNRGIPINFPKRPCEKLEWLSRTTLRRQS